jgi:ribosome biogenesis GTPase
LGWNPYFQQQWDLAPRHNLKPARVVEQQRESYRVICETDELTAEVTGRFRHHALDRSTWPAVGDWVVVEVFRGERKASIHETLPRRSKLSRKAAGERSAEQVLVANIDTVLIVTSLNADLNLRRLERYLNMVFSSGAEPVIVLSKADLCEDIPHMMEQLSAIAAGTNIHVLSALTGDGLDQLNPYIGEGNTVVLVGSSGVGKSTIINALLGADVQATAAIRGNDGRGRHATTYRRLFSMPTGGVLIDTPGLRELQLWDAEHIDETFQEIHDLAGRCHFRNCRHAGEPGCAVQEAIDTGVLDPERLANLTKLQREQDHLDRRRDVAAQSAQRKVWKQRTKQLRQRLKAKDAK